MGKLVDFEGYGLAEYPDDFTDAQIHDSWERNIKPILDAKKMAVLRENAAIANRNAEAANAENTIWQGAKSAVSDVGVGLMKGYVGIPEAIVGLANIPTRGYAGKWVEDAGIDFKGTKEYWDQKYSEGAKAAQAEVDQVDGFIPTGKALLNNPVALSRKIAESLPLLTPGALIARGGLAAAKMIGPRAAAWAAGAAAPLIAGAVGEGAIAAGSMAEGVRQQTEDRLLTWEQAGLSLASGALTGAIGIASGKMAKRLGIDDLDTFLVSGIPTGTAKRTLTERIARGFGGALTEGVLEEMPQSAQEQVANNLALKKPWNEGVAEAAATGLLAGAVMGGAMGGLMPGGQSANPPPIPPPIGSPQAPPALPWKWPVPVPPLPSLSNQTLATPIQSWQSAPNQPHLLAQSPDSFGVGNSVVKLSQSGGGFGKTGVVTAVTGPLVDGNPSSTVTVKFDDGTVQVSGFKEFGFAEHFAQATAIKAGPLWTPPPPRQGTAPQPIPTNTNQQRRTPLDATEQLQAKINAARAVGDRALVRKLSIELDMMGTAAPVVKQPLPAQRTVKPSAPIASQDDEEGFVMPPLPPGVVAAPKAEPDEGFVMPALPPGVVAAPSSPKKPAAKAPVAAPQGAGQPITAKPSVSERLNALLKTGLVRMANAGQTTPDYEGLRARGGITMGIDTKTGELIVDEQNIKDISAAMAKGRVDIAEAIIDRLESAAAHESIHRLIFDGKKYLPGFANLVNAALSGKDAQLQQFASVGLKHLLAIEHYRNLFVSTGVTLEGTIAEQTQRILKNPGALALTFNELLAGHANTRGAWSAKENSFYDTTRKELLKRAGIPAAMDKPPVTILPKEHTKWLADNSTYKSNAPAPVPQQVGLPVKPEGTPPVGQAKPKAGTRNRLTSPAAGQAPAEAKPTDVAKPTPAAAQPEPAAEQPATKPKRVARGSTLLARFNAETERLGPDILSFMVDSGLRVQSKTEAKARGKEYWNQNRGDYDGALPLALPTHNIIYGGSRGPDLLAQDAFEANVIKEPTPDAFWEAVNNASRRRRAAIGNESQDEKFLNEEVAAYERWMKATEEGAIRVSADELQVGDLMDVEGEKVEVIAKDADTGEVTLKDGRKFETQKLQDGESIYVERLIQLEPADKDEANFRGILAQAADSSSKLRPQDVERVMSEAGWDSDAFKAWLLKQPLSDDTRKAVEQWGKEDDFSLAPAESVEEQKARLAAEALKGEADAAAKAKADALTNAINKPLTGTVGDIAQDDMLDPQGGLFNNSNPLGNQPAPPAQPLAPLSPTEEDAARMDAIKKLLAAKLKQGPTYMGSLAPGGLDPEFFKLGTELGYLYIKSGVRKFSDFAARLINDLGEKAKPYLLSWYSNAKLTLTSIANELDSESKAQQYYQDTFGRPVQGGRVNTGAVTGSGVAGGRPGVRVARQELIPVPRQYVDAGAYSAASGFQLDEEQVRGVNLMVDRFKNVPAGAFLLADGTGFGKTAQLLAVADQYSKQGLGNKILIVTKNKTIADIRFAGDAKRMGIDPKSYTITTYSGLKNIESKGWDLVLFDEAHELKNSEAAKSIAGGRLQAKHKVFATATPMDTFTGAAYFLSEITGEDETQIATKLGYKLVERTDPYSKEVFMAAVLLPESTAKTVWQNIMAYRDAAVANGSMIRREYPFFGKVEDADVSMDRVSEAEQKELVQYYDNLIDSVSSPTAKRNYAGQKTLSLRRWSEQAKIGPAIQMALDHIAGGGKAIVVAETDKQQRFPVQVRGSKWGKDKSGIEGWLVPGAITQMMELLEKAGVYDVSHIHDPKSNNISSEVDKFQRGPNRLALATPQSGGTGIDLDDSIGGQDRLMISLSKNLAGDTFQQLIGRVSRKNTVTPSTVRFLNLLGSFADERSKNILDKKVKTLLAIQGGEELDAAAKPDDTDITQPGQQQPPYKPSPNKPASTAPPRLDWNPYTTQKGKQKFVAKVTPEFTAWYKSNGENRNSFGIFISDRDGRAWADANPNETALQSRTGSTTKDDTDYLAAVKAGDTETAQKMDEAAKKAGYSRKMLHRTKAKTAFDVFKTNNSEMGAHFGTKEQIADMPKGKVSDREYYIKAVKSFRMQDIGGFDPANVAASMQEKGMVNDAFVDKVLNANNQTAHRLVQEKLKEKGYDSIIYLNRREGTRVSEEHQGSFEIEATDKEFKAEYPHAKDSIIAFDPSQIKSADPITRDAQGNVIPLSQRFNQNSESILQSRIGSVSGFVEGNDQFTTIPSDEELSKWMVGVETMNESLVKPKNNSKADQIGDARTLPAGHKVGLRIDIPTFNRSKKAGTPVYAISIHESKSGGKVGKIIGYDGVATVTNPTFWVNESGSEQIALGESSKKPLATVEGNFSQSREIPSDINEWTAVGFDPIKHSYFYDKKTGELVVGGDIAISVGNTVFVKNPRFGNKEDALYRRSDTATGLPASAVEAHLAQAYGSVPNGVIRVVERPDLNFDGQVILDAATGEFLRIEINASKLNSLDDIDKILTHEFSHIVFRDPGVQSILGSLTDQERAQIEADMTRLGYTPDSLQEEGGARGIEQLANAWRGRNWFTQVVGRVLAWASEHGLKMTRLAAEMIAARAVAKVKAEVFMADEASIQQVSMGSELALQSRVVPDNAADLEIATAGQQVAAQVESIYASYEAGAQSLSQLALEKKEFRQARAELNKLTSLASARMTQLPNPAPGMTPDPMEGISVQANQVVVGPEFSDKLTNLGVAHNAADAQAKQGAIFFERVADGVTTARERLKDLEAKRNHHISIKAPAADIAQVENTINSNRAQIATLEQTEHDGVTAGQRADEIAAAESNKIDAEGKRDALKLAPVDDYFGGRMANLRELTEKAKASAALAKALMAGTTDPAELARLTAEFERFDKLPETARDALVAGKMTDAQLSSVVIALQHSFVEFDLAKANMDDLLLAEQTRILKDIAQAEKDYKAALGANLDTEAVVDAALRSARGSAGLVGSVNGAAKIDQLLLETAAISGMAQTLGQNIEQNRWLYDYLSGVRSTPGGILAFSKANADALGIGEDTLRKLVNAVQSSPALGSALVTLADHAAATRANNYALSLATTVPSISSLAAQAQASTVPSNAQALLNQANAAAATLASAVKPGVRATSKTAQLLSSSINQSLTQLAAVNNGASLFNQVANNPAFVAMRQNANGLNGLVINMIEPGPAKTTFLGFGTTSTVYHPELVINVDDDPAMSHRTQGHIYQWSEAAKRYVADFDLAELAHRANPAANPTPGSLGFDRPKVIGLRTALEKQVNGSFLEVSLMDEAARTSIPKVVRKMLKRSMFRQHDFVARLVGGIYGTDLRVTQGRWIRGHLNARRVAARFQDMPDLQASAMASHGIKNISTYRSQIWNQMGGYGREFGSKLKVGFTLPVSGQTITKEDMVFFKRTIDFEEQLRRFVTEVDNTRGVREKIGGQTFVRGGGSVGDYGMPRHLGRNATAFIADIISSYLNTKGFTVSSDLSAASTEAVPAFWNKRVDMLKQHILDSTRTDRAMRQDPTMRKAEMAIANRWLSGAVDPVSSLQDLAQLLAAELATVPGINPMDYAVRHLNSELIQYHEHAVRIKAEREDPSTRNSGLSIALSSDNEFTKPAAKLELPHSLYDYGALTTGERISAQSRANHEMLVEYANALRRAIGDLKNRINRFDNNQISEAEAARSYGGGMEELRDTFEILSASLVDFEAGYKLGADPALSPSALASELARFPVAGVLALPTVSIRNLTGGQLVVYLMERAMGYTGARLAMYNAIKNAPKALAKASYASALNIARFLDKNLLKTNKKQLEDIVDIIAKVALSPVLLALKNPTTIIAGVKSDLDQVQKLGYDTKMGFVDAFRQAWKESGLYANREEEEAALRSPTATKIGRVTLTAAKGINAFLGAVGVENSDQVLNSVNLVQSQMMETRLGEVAMKFGARLESLGITSIDPTDRRSILLAAEWSPFLNAQASLDSLGQLRLFLEGSAASEGFQLENALLKFYQETKAGKPTHIFSAAQFEAVQRGLLAQMNTSLPTNRASVAAGNRMWRILLTLQGYPSDAFLKLINTAVGGTRNRTVAAQAASKLPLLIGIAMMAIIIGGMSDGASEYWKRKMQGIPSQNAGVLDRDFWQNKDKFMSGAGRFLAANMFYLGDVILGMQNQIQGNRGFDPASRVFPISLAQAFASAIQTTFATYQGSGDMSDVATPMVDFFAKLTPGGMEIRNWFGANKMLRRSRAITSAEGRAADMELPKQGGQRSAGPTTIVKRNLESAVGAMEEARVSGDTEAYAKAEGQARAEMAKLENYYIKRETERGKSPEEAAKEAKAAVWRDYQEINPVSSALGGRRPTASEYQTITTGATGARAITQQAGISAWQQGANALFNKTGTVTRETASASSGGGTGGGSGGGYGATMTASSGVGRATSGRGRMVKAGRSRLTAGRATRSSLSRPKFRTRLRAPRNRKVSIKRVRLTA